MAADVLLSRLVGVRESGRGRWIALCPAHDDMHPSLSIRELDDGRLLAHCFAGCSIESVLGAVGLDFDVLFPENALDSHRPRERKPYSVRDLVAALRFELTVALVILADVRAGKPMSDHDRGRAGKAADRILHFMREIDHAR